LKELGGLKVVKAKVWLWLPATLDQTVYDIKKQRGQSRKCKVSSLATHIETT